MIESQAWRATLRVPGMHLDYLARREMPRMRIGRAGHARTSSQEGTLGEPL